MQSPPLSNSRPHRGERKKQIPLFPIFLFFLFFKDRRFYLCKKKVKQKNFFIFYKNLLSLRHYQTSFMGSGIGIKNSQKTKKVIISI
jgi:hypothetical protein